MRMPKPTIYCPKCNSENVEVVCLNLPKPERHSIDELPLQNTQVVLAIRVYSQWRATCADCGYSKEYSLPAAVM